MGYYRALGESEEVELRWCAGVRCSKSGFREVGWKVECTEDLSLEEESLEVSKGGRKEDEVTERRGADFWR